MNIESIEMGARDWLWPAIGLGGLGLAVLVWSYLRTPGRSGLRFGAALLKALGIVALAACLVEPMATGQRPRPGSNVFVMMADNSQSMNVRAAGESQTRGEMVRKLLGEEEGWQTRLAQDFDVRRYLFDDRLEPVEDFKIIPLDGETTALASSLRMVAERFKGRPVSGVLLLTEGAATDLSGVHLQVADLPPIYPVIVGGDKAGKDITVGQVAATQTNFEIAPVTVMADIYATGYDGQPVVVELQDQAGEMVERRVETVPLDGRPISVRFQVRPEEVGLVFYQVKAWAQLDGEPGAAATVDEETTEVTVARSPEATVANNARLMAVDRGGGPYRVLYVSGRPNPEFKYIRRSIEEDEEVQLVAIIRVARREPKFNFIGRSDERTNPLYRGFGDDVDENAEDYHQPVLRLFGDLQDSEEVQMLQDGFPKSAEQLYRYDAIILDDIEKDFFTADEMALMQTFVSRRGGGLMMLGGQESFAEGNYYRSPVGEMLPIYLTPNEEFPLPGQHEWILSREGWIQPWVRTRSTEQDEENRLLAMPRFGAVNRLQTIKAGASIMAYVQDERENRFPALVVQNFGEGRVAAVTVGDLWRWALHRKVDEPRELEKIWRQTVRWLVGDVPQRVEVVAERDANEPGMPVRMTVRVRNKEFKALDNAQVQVTVEGPNGDPLELTALPSDTEAGVYETTYVPRDTGAYRAKVVVKDHEGVQIGEEKQTGWVAQPAADEFRDLGLNRALLESIAQQTGGEVIEAADLDAFVADLPSRKIDTMETWTYPLWHTPLVFLLAIGCLVVEWGLRRINGLP